MAPIGTARKATPKDTYNNFIYVVGLKFKSFCDYNTVWDIHTAIAQLPEIARTYERIILGQGISTKDCAMLTTNLRLIDAHKTIQLVEHISRQVDKEMVHKSRDCNVMISHPVQIHPSTYESYLIIDDSCAEMSDHRSADQIQGSVLIEAARQMFMACVSEYGFSSETKAKIDEMQFSLSEVRALFHLFIFPLETRVELRFCSSQVRDKSAIGKAHVKFFQNSNLCCEVFCEAQALSTELLKTIAAKSARHARRSAIVDVNWPPI